MINGDRLYRALVRLYPAEFQRRYGRAMEDFHRDRLSAARAARRSIALVWLRAAADVAYHAPAEHLSALLVEEPVLQTLFYDLAFAVRGLTRRPGFTAIVVATIALGVGANAAIFSVVSGILLRPLPYPHAERVIAFGHRPPIWLTAEADFLDYRRDMKSLDGLAAFTQNEVTLTEGDEPERIRIVRASEDFFPVLGVEPLLGRVFAPDEYQGNPPTVVVLSHGLWQRRFAGDRALLGKRISIGGTPRTVVGIMPPRFDYPSVRTDLWQPMPRLSPDTLNGRGNHYLFMVGRVKAASTIDAATAEANGIAQRIMRLYPTFFNPVNPLAPEIKRVGEELVGTTRPYLFALLGAVGFVLLIACANVANLLLVRGETRRKEMALRGALGASALRLLVQTLTESSVLALLGGTVGLLLAWAGDRALVALAPASIPRLDSISVDWRVVVFTTVTVVLSGLMIGAVPAWRAARENVADALKDGSRTLTVSGAAGRARRSLVVAEVALAMIALTGAGMLLRSLWHLESASLGFDPHGVLTAKVSVAPREYNNERAAAFFEQLVDRIRSLPGVTQAGASGWLPVVDAGGLWGIDVEGRAYPPGQGPAAVPQQITPGYFESVGMPVVAGRDFSRDDRASALPVAIVSRRMAALLWGTAAPLGRRFKVSGPAPWVTVVGVVDDIRARGFSDTPEPTMYFPHAQTAISLYAMPRTMALLVKTSADPMTLVRSVSDAVHALDRSAPMAEPRTLESVIGVSVANRRFSTALLAGFAVLALVLAGIGTYGVISYGVSQRASELGVRMALGAERRSVLTLVLAEGVRMCAWGVAVGIAGSLIAARAIRTMLVGVSAVDPETIAVVSVALMVVAMLAALLPARRATQVNPIDVLRG